MLTPLADPQWQPYVVFPGEFVTSGWMLTALLPAVASGGHATKRPLFVMLDATATGRQSPQLKEPPDPRPECTQRIEHAGAVRAMRRHPAQLAPRARHDKLVQAVNRKVESPHGQVTVTRYLCDHCSTVWDMRTTKPISTAAGRWCSGSAC